MRDGTGRFSVGTESLQASRGQSWPADRLSRSSTTRGRTADCTALGRRNQCVSITDPTLPRKIQYIGYRYQLSDPRLRCASRPPVPSHPGHEW